MADWIGKQGDSGPSFVQELSFEDGTVPNLTGATLSMTMRSLAGASVSTITGSVSAVDEVNGVVSYTPSSADTATAGNFMQTWTVTFPTGQVLTFPTDGYNWFEIQESLAGAAEQLVSLPDVKEYLRIDATEHEQDHEIMVMIRSVRAIIETACGPIIPTTYDEKYDGGGNIIQLRNRPSYGAGTSPIMTLIAASEFRGPIEYPLALIQNPVFGSIYSVELDPTQGTVTRRTAGGGVLAFMPGRNSTHFVYQAGQAGVPDNVRHAAMEIVRVNLRTTAPAGRGRLTEADQENAGGSARHPGFFIPESVDRILHPTRRAPSFA